MMLTIEIEGKRLGKKKRLFENFSVPIATELASKELRLEEFLPLVVRQQVQEFKQRQEQRKFIAVLSAEDIKDGVTSGKISMGGSDLDDEVDMDQAIATAIQAFEDGFFYVFLDGQQVESLSTVMNFHMESKVTFVRLVPLAGG